MQPREYPFVPSRFGLWYEDVKLVAKDGTKIHGWLVKPAGDPKPLGGLAHIAASMCVCGVLVHWWWSALLVQ